MTSEEFLQRLEELNKQTNLKFKYHYSYIPNCGCFDEMWINETQTPHYLIDRIKDDLESGRSYNTISYDTDDYYRRYIDINDIIIKDGFLVFN